MLANADNQSIYWEKERELGGVEGPVGLMLINTAVGYLALASGDKYTKLSVGWNSFVAVLGRAPPPPPSVWPKLADTADGIC